MSVPKKAFIMGILIASQFNTGQCPQRDSTSIQGATDAPYIDLMSAISSATNENGQMLTPQEVMQISIDADTGLRDGGSIGYFSDGYGNQIPYYIPNSGNPTTNQNLTQEELNSIKIFFQNFKKIWCSMNEYFSKLTIIEKYQAVLFAIGAGKTLEQFIDGTRRTITAVTAGVNGVFEWWRSVGQTKEATDAVKSVIESMGPEKVNKAISDGGGTKAYDEFCRANPGVCLPNLKLDAVFRDFKGTNKFSESFGTNSPTWDQETVPYPHSPFSGSPPPGSFTALPYSDGFQSGTQISHGSLPNRELYNSENSQSNKTNLYHKKNLPDRYKKSNQRLISEEEKRKAIIWKNRPLDILPEKGGRKRTKRRKQGKSKGRKTKRRKSITIRYKNRRSSSRKR